MKTYTARALQWDGGWELHIVGVGVTQSHTLDDAERMVRSYVSMNTGADGDSFEVEIIVTECNCPPDFCFGSDSDAPTAGYCAACAALDPELPCVRDQPGRG